MSNKTLGLSREFYSYYQSITVKEPEILQKLREETAQHPRAIMQIAPEQGQFLAFLVQLIGARKTLEIGVFTGYSSLVTALALPPEGKIIACDVSEEYTEIARRYWQEAGVSKKIDLRIAPALETLDQLLAEGHANTFDFIFIDADKGNYDNYYEKSLKLVRGGGIIAIDNVFWGGKVADLEIQDNQTNKIREFNKKLYEDDRINLSVVPIADGLTLAMKKGIGFATLIQGTNFYMREIGWDIETARNYLIETYGKRSRQLLTDDELLEFHAHLQLRVYFPLGSVVYLYDEGATPYTVVGYSQDGENLILKNNQNEDLIVPKTSIVKEEFDR
ncbi:hypothetical protein C7H19_01820 [Aphanothece hegewaldii CCALA 016]|uniref:SAM-dependent methyltransferase n=1 Tax=Aphanothece hegewaldii CCALA 016 TaxID=2107694 RepID=A0A2T1M410_9CHRO|nr:hypothetical protein C7H19_01820 [Aphanothece hegewaldii CCALA 016]